MAVYYCILVIISGVILQVKSDLENDFELKLKIWELKMDTHSYEMRLMKKELQDARKEISVLQARMDNVQTTSGEHKDLETDESLPVRDKVDMEKSGIQDLKTHRKSSQLVDQLLKGFMDEKKFRNRFEKETYTSIDTLSNELKTVNDSKVSRDENLRNYESLKAGLQEQVIKLTNITITNEKLQDLKDMLESVEQDRQNETKDYQSKLESLQSDVQILRKCIVTFEEKHGQQVAFYARVDANQEINPGSTAIVLVKSVLNVGEGLSTKTGVFTAPLAGVYVFHVKIVGIGDDLFMCLYVNRIDHLLLFDTESQHQVHQADSNLLVIKLKQGDAVHVARCLYTGKKPFTVLSDYSTFSGFLLYPD